MYANLRQFVEALDRAGELVRIMEPVSPVLEISACADIASKLPAPAWPSSSAERNDAERARLGGPALLFENVEGSGVPVLINALGSYRRMEMVLGCEGGGFDEIAERIAELIKPQPPRGIGEAIARAGQLAPLLRIGTRRVARGACQQVVRTGDDIDLTTLPLIRCWPLDGDLAGVGYPADVNAGIVGCGSGAGWDERFRGRYITLAGVHTIHPDDLGSPRPASHNIGMYRVQMLGPKRCAMHWHIHHDGAAHWRAWKRRGEAMPVAIVLGGEAVLPYAATAPLPPGMSELLFAGFLNGGGVRLCRARTVPLWVPAEAEIVIEGYVSHESGEIGFDPRAIAGGTPAAPGPGAAFEGPFGDHTGFYSLPDRYPIMDVTAVTHRRDPIYPTTVVGLPPQEDYFLGKATERLFLPMLRVLIPDIEDYDLPMFGCFHNCAFIRIRKQYPLHARRVMHAVWGAGQMSWTKTIIVVDEAVDVHDVGAVLRAVAARCWAGRDVERVRGPLDILDHAAPTLGGGTKIGFDATRRVPGEESVGSSIGPERVWMEPARGAFCERVGRIAGVVAADWPTRLGGWAIVSIGVRARDDKRRLIDALLAGDAWDLPAFVVLVGPDVDARDTDGALFHWCANADMERDVLLGASGGTMVFDATPKLAGEALGDEPVRAWPAILRMDDAAAARARGILSRAGVRDIN